MQLNDLTILFTCVETKDQAVECHKIYVDMLISEKVLLKSKLMLKSNEEQCITVKTKNSLKDENNSTSKDILIFDTKIQFNHKQLITNKTKNKQNPDEFYIYRKTLLEKMSISPTIQGIGFVT